MSEALHSFLVSVSCIIGVALLIPSVELLARRLRRQSAIAQQPEIVQITPTRPQRRSTL